MNQPAFEQLVRARTALILDEPFFGSLALRLTLKEDSTIKTLAVGVTFAGQCQPMMAPSASRHGVKPSCWASCNATSPESFFGKKIIRRCRSVTTNAKRTYMAETDN